MKTLAPPLTDEETAELVTLLAAAGGASFAFAHGVFAAAASGPTAKDVTDWLPWIVGDRLPDRDQLKRLFALLMRDFHACKECLSLGVPAVPTPDDDDAVTQFCKGYMRVAHADARWKADMEAFALTIPFAVLSGYIAPESLATLRPEIALDPAAFRAQQAAELSERTAQVYAYFAPMREANAQTVIGKGKVGRNDPCPCESGKKYKKCCGAS